MSMHGTQANAAAVEAGRPDVSSVDVTGLDLTHAAWKKSSYSGGNASCVEVADLGEHIAVRDSKDRSGPKLIFTSETWRAFLAELKTGLHGL